VSVQVFIENVQTEVPVGPEMHRLIERVIAAAAEQERLSSGEVSILLVDDREIQRYNARYRGVDQPTDVLSFSMLEGDSLPDQGIPILLGDILISMPRAVSQAAEYGHSLERELGFLVVHGFLHLLGYDHDTPEAEREMFARQESVLTRLGLFR
jgi:probable rRNA maturation factor